ncbi:TRAP-type C4-dicarboxylate transport system, substrate-binding protein [Paucidesulfovibrio gracilis DSM 16080]|uniref:TRAP-type C4-dicarboxylate transport system, substrate-binding protein n=1 Tax=Paucidesulfovibrio gracilis DSM 16080 TaxID=1121449 RepID=A0A1T4WQ48_9BACT|nr:TRAP transporter substrate-binding protein [Paucidesulfovibrio gracilis]SKA78988.1 TRAP-type C4-dicarboxylate transport system, substrate-binding protein [Paucidesulfovibrio gracilis DSM 16080]
MRPRTLLTGCLAVLLSLWVLPTHASEFRLSYSCFFPPTHVQSQLAEQWCREVEARTDGQVRIDYYPGGTLTKAKQCYDGVVEGISDIGFSALAYSRGRFPVMAAVDLPLGYTSGMQATKVANSVYEHFQPQELQDVQVMYFNAHGPGLLHTREISVTRLEQLKGLKLRATGNSAQLVQALGGTPVAQSMPEAYQSIQKGVVDGGMYPVETNKGWKMAEVVDYMTESYSTGYTTTFFVVMNKDRWESLPDDVRKAIQEVNAEWIAKHGQAWDEADKVGRAAFLEQGNQIVPLAAEEAERWQNAAAPLLRTYVDEVSARGVDGDAVLRFTRDALQELR